MTQRGTFDLIPVLENLDKKVECLDVIAGHLYLGTAEGYLLHYSYQKVETDDHQTKYRTRLEKQKQVSSKKIDSVCILTRNSVATLADGVVRLLNAISLEEPSGGAQLKGCNMLAPDRAHGSSHFLITQKKKLILATAKQGLKTVKEFVIPDTCLDASWCGQALCLAFKREYNLLDPSSGAITDICTNEKYDKKGGRPMTNVIVRPGQKAAFLVKMTHEPVCRFVDHVGTKDTSKPITWSSHPLSISYTYPHAVALHQSSIEVYSEVEHKIVQRIRFAKGVSLAQSRVYSQTGNDSAANVFVSQANGISVLEPVAVAVQLNELINRKQIAEAFDLYKATHSRDPNYAQGEAELCASAGYALWSDLAFDRAIPLFCRDKTNDNKRVYLRIVAGTSMDARELISMFPGFLPSLSTFEPSNPLDSTISDMIALKHPNSKMASRELTSALEHLVVYLEDRRSKVEYDEGHAIDTALAKAYCHLRSPQLDHLLNALQEGNAPPRVDVEDLKELLIDMERHNAYALLLLSAGRPRPALEIWRKLGQGQLKDKGPTVGGHVCDGSEETIAFLKTTPQIDLVLAFAGWVFGPQPQKALTIFTERTTPLDHNKALDFLHRVGSRSAEIEYLEWVVVRMGGVRDPILHTQLAMHYLDTALTLKPMDVKENPNRQTGPNRAQAGEEAGILGEVRKKLLSFLRVSRDYDVNAVLSRLRESVLMEEWAVAEAKAGHHGNALTVIVHKLDDPQLAEVYCTNHRRVAGEIDPALPNTKSIRLLALLDTLLHSPDGRPDDRIHWLLETYGTDMDVDKVMQWLPQDWSISSIKGFLQKSISDTLFRQREGSVLASLARAEHRMVSEQYHAARSAGTYVDSARTCAHCGKRLGDMVIARFPNGQVVHFSCFKEKSICPITQRNFLEEPYNLVS